MTIFHTYKLVRIELLQSKPQCGLACCPYDIKTTVISACDYNQKVKTNLRISTASTELIKARKPTPSDSEHQQRRRFRRRLTKCLNGDHDQW